MLELPITGCPFKIFDAIDFVASQHHASVMLLSQSEDPSTLEQPDIAGLSLTLSDLENFDAELYAKDTYCSLAPGHISQGSFVRFCLAWKIAARIYTARVIFTATGVQTYSLLPLVDELIEHCKVVTQECEAIKCFVWPVFIAGVECEGHLHRDWVLSALDQFWQVYLGAKVKVAASVLQILWETMDERSQAANGNDINNQNWIKELYLLNVDQLLRG